MNLRLLLLEDDPVSASFLQAALSALPADVQLAGTLAAARGLAEPGQSLWIFDARLPDGHGGDLLTELRGRGLQVPALALTADSDADVLERLRQSGFQRALAKPLTAQALRAAVRDCLALASPAGDWDDGMALAALGGNPAAVDALRRLFLAELPEQAAAISAAMASADPARAQAQLHRLKASCGFVGAGCLLRAVQRLSANPSDTGAHDDFQRQATRLTAG